MSYTRDPARCAVCTRAPARSRYALRAGLPPSAALRLPSAVTEQAIRTGHLIALVSRRVAALGRVSEVAGSVEPNEGADVSERFEIEQRWPELFEPLSDVERRAVVNTFASNWHEGWVPNRADVENLTLYVRGAITKDEYDQRADEHAERLQTYPGADYTEKMRAWVAEEIREALRTGNDITPTVRIYRGEEAARRGRALIESAVSAEELAELDARTAPDNSTDS